MRQLTSKIFSKNLLKRQFNFQQKFLFSTQAYNQAIKQEIQNIETQFKSLNNKTEEKVWRELEASIINNIHFLDADQFTDTVIAFGRANQGTEVFWDLLSRKIYDYELDTVQCLALKDIVFKSSKPDYFMKDPVLKKLGLLGVIKPKETTLLSKFRL